MHAAYNNDDKATNGVAESLSVGGEASLKDAGEGEKGDGKKETVEAMDWPNSNLRCCCVV